MLEFRGHGYLGSKRGKKLIYNRDNTVLLYPADNIITRKKFISRVIVLLTGMYSRYMRVSLRSVAPLLHLCVLNGQI